jgi:DsbC/DsbD-like thiol-disulfide interchange protein
MSSLLRLPLLLLLLALAAPQAPAQVAPLVRAQLLADTNAIVPGQPFQAGLLLEMADGWHT